MNRSTLQRPEDLEELKRKVGWFVELRKEQINPPASKGPGRVK
jgi:hypothetical protein